MPQVALFQASVMNLSQSRGFFCALLYKENRVESLQWMIPCIRQYDHPAHATVHFTDDGFNCDGFAQHFNYDCIRGGGFNDDRFITYDGFSGNGSNDDGFNCDGFSGDGFIADEIHGDGWKDDGFNGDRFNCDGVTPSRTIIL